MYKLLLLFLVSCTFQCSMHALTLRQPKTFFENIIAFGDSYTDNGSLSRFYEEGTTQISPESLHPETSDLSRACDGPLWIEYLADLYKSRLFDFARSGATANNNLIHRYTQDMKTQVETFIKTETPRNNSVYFLWTGVNDMNELFLQYPESRQGRQLVLDAVIESIKGDLNSLADNGADHIMLMGLIPLETANVYQNITTSTRFELKKLVADYNTRLFYAMRNFKAEHPSISATYFNTHKTFLEILISAGELSRMDCGGNDDCKDLIWWDDLHPSSKTHSIIATAVFDKLIDLQW